MFAPSVVLHGWLIAFASVGGVASALHRLVLRFMALTGGRWGEIGRPALRAGGATLPLVLVFALPLILADRWLYPWAADPRSVPPDVGRFYLNTWSVALRSLVLARRPRPRRMAKPTGALTPLVAALALVVYGGLMSLSAFDWLLSLDPRYTSSAIGMQMIAAQLLSAMCVVVLLVRRARSGSGLGRLRRR